MNARAFNVGDTVKARFIFDHGIGTIAEDNSDGTFHVIFGSGHRERLAGSDLAPCELPARHLPTPPLRFWNYADMVDLPEPEWLVEGLIQRESSALLYGKSNSFKSFLAVDIACSLGSGIGDWHGHPTLKYDGYPVLYVATEGALGLAKKRIPGWYDAKGVPQSERYGVAVYPQEIALDDDDAVADLLRSCGIFGAMRDNHDYDPCPWGAFELIVIDIFGSSMMGPETSDETARAWVSNLNRIKREIGCSALTVAHTGWADETRARMHTHFWGSFDTRLKADGKKDALTTVLSVERHKDAESVGVWGFQMDEVSTPCGNTTLVPRLSDEVSKDNRQRLSGSQQVAMNALTDALVEHGRRMKDTANFPSRDVVSETEWRAMCDRHGLSGTETKEAKRKAFTRARDALMEKNLIRQFDGFVWKVQADGK